MAIDRRHLRHELSFVAMHELERDDLLKVLEIRNQTGVRSNMYTDHEIGRFEHFAWVESLRTSSDSRFYAVFHQEELIGAAGLTAINCRHRRADWAFYLSEKCHGRGLGASLEYHFVNKAFAEFHIDKLNCEVISFNEQVVKLHRKFGFHIEGIRRDHVVRGGDKYDAILLGIKREEWEKQFL